MFQMCLGRNVALIQAIPYASFVVEADVRAGPDRQDVLYEHVHHLLAPVSLGVSDCDVD